MFGYDRGVIQADEVLGYSGTRPIGSSAKNIDGKYAAQMFWSLQSAELSLQIHASL
jgi:hypothetical protein